MTMFYDPELQQDRTLTVSEITEMFFEAIFPGRREEVKEWKKFVKEAEKKRVRKSPHPKAEDAVFAIAEDVRSIRRMLSELVND